MGEEHDEWLKDREAMAAANHARSERERHFHELNDKAKEEEAARTTETEEPRVEEDEDDDDDIEQYTDDER